MKGIPTIPGLLRNPPALEESITNLERRLGHTLPNEYKLFLREADGFSLGGGLLMYSAREIEERNSTWRMPVCLPDYVAIGETGGGDVLLVAFNDQAARLLIAGSGALFPDMLRELAPSLEVWLESGCEIPED